MSTNGEQKPKIDRTKYIIQDKKGETIIKTTGEIDGYNFKLRNLDNCTVYLMDWTKGMFIDDCTECKFIIGPCDGSIFMRTSKNCEVSLISKQLRFRDCENLKIFTYCTTDPVVENSSLISFAPFNLSFPKLNELFTKANFIKGENKYRSVYDFSEAKNINNNKHWELMKDSEFIYDKINLGNQLESDCEPLYDSYLEEIKHLIKDKVEVKTGLDLIGNDDCVMLNNVVLNFDNVIEERFPIVGSSKAKDECYKEVVNDPKNVTGKEEGESAESIVIGDNIEIKLESYDIINKFDVSNNYPKDSVVFSQISQNNLTKVADKKEQSFITYETTNNTNNNFIKLFNNDEVSQSHFDNKNSEYSSKLHLEINNNYIPVVDSNSPKMSDYYNSGDIVIIDSNPRIPSEFGNNNKSDTGNDFFVVNSCSSESPNSNNEFKSPYENFEVLGNEDIDIQADGEDVQAAKRSLKENLERAKRIKELSEEEHKQKLLIKEKAREFINSFNNKRRKKLQENKTANKANESEYLSSKNTKNPNPWSMTLENIEIKEANYPGSNNVSRMRDLIILRKRDFDTNQSIKSFK